MRATVTALALLALAAGCRTDATPSSAAPPAIAPAPASTSASETAPPGATPARAERPEARLEPRPAPARLVAIGDVHGDLEALRRALRLAGAVDEGDRWIGGPLVVVQTGDLLDRGDDERAILALLTRLRAEARAAGGEVVVLSGNHEIMNVQGDLRYVTPAGFTSFHDQDEAPSGDDPRLARFPRHAHARMAALLPGGSMAVQLAEHPVVAQVGDTVFVHGGILPEHVAYGLGRLNAETRAWMRHEGPMPQVLATPSSPVWTRLYADDAACDTLAEALGALGASRLVVGHTIQKDGITSGCDGRVWRIDVGMARHYGGRPAVLEITAAGPRVLAAPAEEQPAAE